MKLLKLAGLETPLNRFLTLAVIFCGAVSGFFMEETVFARYRRSHEAWSSANSSYRTGVAELALADLALKYRGYLRGAVSTAPLQIDKRKLDRLSSQLPASFVLLLNPDNRVQLGSSLYRPYVQIDQLQEKDPRIIRSLVGSDKAERAIKKAKFDLRFGSRPELLSDIPFVQGNVTKDCKLSNLPILANRSGNLGYEILAPSDLKCLGIEAQLPSGSGEQALALIVVEPSPTLGKEILIAGLLLNHLDELTSYFRLHYAAGRTTVFAGGRAVLTNMPDSENKPAYGRIAPESARLETLGLGKLHDYPSMSFGNLTFSESYFPLFRDGDNPKGTDPVGMIAVASGEAVKPELEDAHRELLLISAGLVIGISILFVPINLVIASRERELGRRRSEKEQANQLKDIVLMSVEDGICGLENQGKIIFANRRATEMFGTIDSTGLFIGAFVHPNMFEQLFENLLRGTSARGQIQILSNNGDALECDYTLTPMCDFDNQLLSATFTFRDIGDRLALQQEREATVISNERNRINQEMHDGLVSTLTRLKLQIETANRFYNRNSPKCGTHLVMALELSAECLLEADLSVSSMERISNQGEKISEQLERIVKTADSDRVVAKFNINGEPQDVSPEAALAIFRALQECIKNTIQHAHATNIEVELSFLHFPIESLSLKVKDNGRGFENTALMKSRGSGIASMQKRLEEVAGGLRIESIVGSGTTITIWVPSTTSENNV